MCIRVLVISTSYFLFYPDKVKMSGKQMLEQRDLSVFTNVFLYCFNIIVLPIAAFFLSKSVIFDGLLQLSHMKSSVCSAVTAVVALHLALGLYIYKAYSGDDKPPSKRDYGSGCGSVSDVDEECMAALPAIVDDVLTQYDHMPVARQWFAQVLKHHLPFQPISMGFAVVETYRELAPAGPDLPLAYLLAWCVEMLGANLALTDDIHDDAAERFGRVCWYRSHGLGLTAINDASFLNTIVFSLLRRHTGQRPFYPALVRHFHQVAYVTYLGQLLDLRTVGEDGLPRWQLFTDDYQRSLCRYKAEHYIAYLPVTAALHLTGCKDEQLRRDVSHVLGLLGRLFQIQDDYLDVFGDLAETGKGGNDIPAASCSWMMIRALEAASPAQRARLMEHYGRADPDSASVVKQLYRDLGIPQMFARYEDELHHDIVEGVRSSPPPTQRLLLRLLAKLYRRQLPTTSLLQHSSLQWPTREQIG